MASPRRMLRRLDPSLPARRALAKVPGAGVADVVPRTLSFLAGSEVRRLRYRRNSRPIARPSPLYTAQVALDEALLGALASTRMPKPSDYPRLGGEVLEALEMWRREGWLDAPAAYHREPPPLVEVEARARHSRGFRYEHIRFESGYQPHADEPGAARWMARTPDRTAHAWVARHAGPPRPWLVCIHGMGMGTPVADLSAFNAKHLFHERGVNLMFPVLPAHGPRRRSGGRLPDVPGADQLDLIHLAAQGLWDIRRLIGWVAADGAPVIGVHGISLGGFMTALTVAFEPRVDLAIAGVPVVDFIRLERHHANASQRRRGERHHLLGEEARSILRVVSPLEFPPLLPPEKLGVYGGLGDRVATSAQAQALYERWGEPPMCWFPGGHIGFMWSGDARRFLAERLDTAGLIGPPG